MKKNILKAGKIALFTSLTFFASKQVFGQCTTPTFQDDFNTPNLWTISDASGCSATDGNGRILNTGGTNGNLSFTGIEAAGCIHSTTTGARNGSNLRGYRSIVNASNNLVTLSNTNWTAEFKFRITNGNGLCHTLLAVTAGNQHPQGQYVTFTDDGVTQTNFVQSSQDGIFASIIAYGDNQYPGSTTSRPFIQSVQNWDQTHMGSTTDPADMGWRIYGHAKNGNGPFYTPDENISPVAASNINNPTANYSRGISLPAKNTDYYLRLERTSESTCQISVFTDAAMSNHVIGSPQCFTIDPNIINLNTIQNSTHASGVRTRTAEGSIDDLKIFDNCNPHKFIPNITCNNTFCQGVPINVTGSNTGNTAAVAHYWEILECQSDGTPVTNGYVYYTWNPGNPGNYQFPNSNLACNKYYRIKLAFSNMTECLPWAETSKIIYIACNPTPEITTGGANICLGSSWTLCTDYMASSNISIGWSVGGSKSNNKQCITVTPTTPGQYPYTVTVNNLLTGCSGQATAIVNVFKNDPTFSYNVNTSNSSYNTITATGNDANAGSTPGFGHQWFIDEINPTNGSVISSTNQQNPNCWWAFPPNSISFQGFNQDPLIPVDCINGPIIGRFSKTKTYRITRGTWNSYCGWAQSSQVINPQTLRAQGTIISGVSSVDSPADYKKLEVSSKIVKESLTMQVYPNPSKGLLNITLHNTSEGEHSIEVFDVFGKLIYKTQENNNQGSEFKSEINLTDLNLSNGLYLINISTANQILSQKVMIQK